MTCDVLRLIDVYRSKGLYVGGVVLTCYEDHASVQGVPSPDWKAQGIAVYLPLPH